MKNWPRTSAANAVGIVLVTSALAVPGAQAEVPEGKPTAVASATETQSAPESRTVKIPLFFVRHATKFKEILDNISGAAAKTEKTNDTDGAAGTNGATRTGNDPDPTFKGLIVGAPDENTLVLYGPGQAITAARRLIAAIDLPVPGIQMDVWGIQVSSRDPQQLERALKAVREDTEMAKAAVREVYRTLEVAAAANLGTFKGTDVVSDEDKAAYNFQQLLQGKDNLGYTSALQTDRSLSITDILLLLIAATPEKDLAFSNDLTKQLGYGSTNGSTNAVDTFRYKYAAFFNKGKTAADNTDSPPFEHLLTLRELKATTISVPTANSGNISYSWEFIDKGGARLSAYNKVARKSVLEFAFNYHDLIEQPNAFSPYYLQTSADTLNSRIQLAVEAINKDIYDLIIQPTLDKIGRDVLGNNVEYAQVGRVRVASLNGVLTKVAGTSVSTFDSTPPLRLSDVLKNAAAVPTTGEIPQSQLLSLLAATDADRTVTNELSQGVSLEVTPNILRNASSAELAIHLTVGDPQGATREAGVPPLSRISKHEITDTIYLNALDVFDLSTFSSQARLNGGRSYTPLIGPVWHGIFGDIPVLGDLFSWKKNPKDVYHQSVLFANSIISPTVMGLALLYPIQYDTRDASSSETGTDRKYLQKRVSDYITDPAIFSLPRTNR